MPLDIIIRTYYNKSIKYIKKLSTERNKHMYKNTIRIARAEDAEELLRIYAPYVKETAITFEYEVPTVEEFKERIIKTLQRYPYLVAEVDGEAVGYAYAGAFKERAAYDWAVESTVYIKNNKRKMGIGSELYNALEKILHMQNIINVNACIAYTDNDDEYLTKGSVMFHENMGYKTVGRFHKCGYKFNKWYDMVWMEKHLDVHPTYVNAVKRFSDINLCDLQNLGISIY